MESALIFYHVKNYMLVNNLFDLLTFLFFLYSIKQLVSVVLENYGAPNKKSENMDPDKQCHQSRWVQEVLKNEGHVSSLDITMRLPSWRTILNDKGEVNLTL
jgi:hypothetical protein